MCATVLRAEGHKLTWFNLGIDNLVWENIRYCWWALVSEQGLQRCSDKPWSLWNAASSVNLEALGAELSSCPGFGTWQQWSWLPWIPHRHTGVLAPDLERIRCWLSAACCCNPSWEGQIGVTCDFQVSFWSPGPLFAAWPHVHSNTATVPHLPYRAAHLLPSTPFEVQGARSLTYSPNLPHPT